CPLSTRRPALNSAISFPLSTPPPSSTLFPYTTLFRSRGNSQVAGKRKRHCGARRDAVDRCHDWGRQLHHRQDERVVIAAQHDIGDRKSTRLNSSHQIISYAVFCLKKKNQMIS